MVAEETEQMLSTHNNTGNTEKIVSYIDENLPRFTKSLVSATWSDGLKPR